MRVNRIHHPGPLADGSEFELTKTADRHLTRVLRLATGDAFVVFDGSGHEWPATLLGGGRARTGTGTGPAREPALTLTLVQAVTRGERMDHTLQKAVELGASAVQPVFSRRCEVKLDGARLDKRVEHWRKVIIAACEQSGRMRVPGLARPVTLEAWLGDREAVTGWVLDPEAARALPATPAPDGPAHLLVGPEGGLEPGETRAAAAAGLAPVRLGPRVLRTETAGPAALAALQALWGDFRD